MPPTLSIMRLYDDDPTLPAPAWHQLMRQSTDFAGAHSLEDVLSHTSNTRVWDDYTRAHCSPSSSR